MGCSLWFPERWLPCRLLMWLGSFFQWSNDTEVCLGGRCFRSATQGLLTGKNKFTCGSVGRAGTFLYSHGWSASCHSSLLRQACHTRTCSTYFKNTDLPWRVCSLPPLQPMNWVPRVSEEAHSSCRKFFPCTVSATRNVAVTAREEESCFLLSRWELQGSGDRTF